MIRGSILTLLLLVVTGCAQLRVAPGRPLPVRGPQLVALRSNGDRTQANIMTVILAQKARLGACVEAERAVSGATGKAFVKPGNPGFIEKEVLLVWDILPSGEVANVGVRDPEYAGLEISQCLATVIRACRFAASEQGDQITFPFRF